MEQNKAIEATIDEISPEALDKVGDVISKIEMSKQQTALAQIEATSEDNQRQFEFAMKQAELNHNRWNKAFLVGTISAGILAISSLAFLFKGDTAIGLGLLGSTITGVFGYLAGVGSSK